MRPIAFDGCLGWLHDGTGTRGVVMCSALGLDEQCARQSWRILADEIAAAGMPTLRFDYHGTGDSAGLLADPERLSTWLANIETAAAWLQGQAGITELVFVGLRFGATLATVAAAAHGKVARLVLLAPLASGRAYGRELQLASHVMVATGGDKATPDARNSGITDYGVDVAGFVIPRHVLDDLRQIDLMRPMRLPAKDVLAHMRSVASAPSDPTNRPDHASQAAMSLASNAMPVCDSAARAAVSCVSRECSSARRNNSSLLANCRYSPWRDTPAARATSSMEALRKP